MVTFSSSSASTDAAPAAFSAGLSRPLVCVLLLMIGDELDWVLVLLYDWISTPLSGFLRYCTIGSLPRYLDFISGASSARPITLSASCGTSPCQDAPCVPPKGWYYC